MDIILMSIVELIEKYSIDRNNIQKYHTKRLSVRVDSIGHSSIQLSRVPALIRKADERDRERERRRHTGPSSICQSSTVIGVN